MAYDLGRLASYVRFYLTVVEQLRGAWDNLGRTHATVRDALAPFSEGLAPVGSPALAAALGDAASAKDLTAALFVPDDPDALAGLTDVYEVVGRFSFQGQDDDNLARVQALVSTARNEIVAQRMRLADLGRLPESARVAAARLAAEEDARSRALREERGAAFEPLADQVQTRAKQTMDAVRAVAIPDLASADTAAEDYRRFAAKLDQVYQTCLPFLRKAIAALYALVGAEPTATWPDALPVIKELPAELVTVPPADSPELSGARASLRALGEEEMQLGRARDEVATTVARFEGELAAGAVRAKELEVDSARTTELVDYAAAIEGMLAARQSMAALERQKADRLRAAGEVWQRHQQIEAGLKLLEEELGRRNAELAATGEVLAAEKKAEPVLFGKDDWRSRVAALEAQSEALRSAYAARLGTLGGLKIDLSSVSVQVQTEQQHASLVDRQLADVRATMEGLQKSLATLTASLGSDRPAHPVPSADARAALAALQQAAVETGQRQDRLRAEIRRQKEETVRILTRMKQVGVERQQVQAMVQSAQVAATEGHEGALRHLAGQRRGAVDRHVAEVLGTLEKSLTMVGSVFVEPARKLMIAELEARTSDAATLLDAAERLAPVVAKLATELDGALLAQDAGLGQIQREFCDVAPSACRAAWA